MDYDLKSNFRATSTPKAIASWGAVASIGLGACLIVTSEFLPVGLLPEMARDLGVTEGQAGLMITLPGIIAAFSALLTIAYVGHIDRRRVLWVLLTLVAISNIIASLSSDFIVMLTGRVLLGVALGGFWTIAGSLGPRLRPDAESTKATALIFSGISLGTIAGVPLGVFIGTNFGWRVAFSTTAVAAAIVVLALIILLPAIPAQRGNGLKAVPEVTSRQAVKLALLATMLVFAGQFAAYTYITPFLIQTSQISGGMLSVFLLTFGFTGFIGNLFGGWLAASNPRSAVSLSACMLACSILLLVTTGDGFRMAAIAVALWGFAFGMAPVSLQTFTLNAAPDHLETAAALLVFVLQIAIGVGAFSGGLIADRYGSDGAFVIGIIATLSASALTLLSTKR